MAFFENEDPSFGKEVGDRAGRVIFGCSDILEVNKDYTLAKTHLTGKVSKLVVLRDTVVCSRVDRISVYNYVFPNSELERIFLNSIFSKFYFFYFDFSS